MNVKIIGSSDVIPCLESGNRVVIADFYAMTIVNASTLNVQQIQSYDKSTTCVFMMIGEGDGPAYIPMEEQMDAVLNAITELYTLLMAQEDI